MENGVLNMTTLNDLLAGTREEKALWLIDELDIRELYMRTRAPHQKTCEDFIYSSGGCDAVERAMIERDYDIRITYGVHLIKGFWEVQFSKYLELWAAYSEDKSTAIIDAAIEARWKEGE